MSCVETCGCRRRPCYGERQHPFHTRSPNALSHTLSQAMLRPSCQQAITKPHPVPSNPHINRLIRISIPHFRRLANWLYHLLLIPSTRIQYIFVHARRTYLNHLRPNLLSAFSHSNSHIAQQRRMPNVTGIAVSLDIARPLESCRVCVPRSDISRLEGFELLLCA